jgi:NAD(P)-dependent dehydrogenase (short-subunit alcohol dehydrogenase family)
MNIEDKVVVVTGGASGIGLALCTRFSQNGAHVVLSDLHHDACQEKAAPIGAVPVAADVGKDEHIAHLVAATLERFGRLDMFCSNAGIGMPGGEEVPDDKWHLIYDVNVLAHVRAARYALPHMLERGSGYLFSTASAAALAIEFHSAPYTVSKHDALGFAEWLATTYGDRGIAVSVLCPAAVKTPIIAGIPSLEKTAISTDVVVDTVMEAIAEERFLISTHDSVMRLFELKGRDYERYLATLREKRADWVATDVAQREVA